MASSIRHAVAARRCYTEQKIEKVSYMWTINNFTFCFKDKKGVVDSPAFPGGASKTLWQLRIEKCENVSINILLKYAQAKEATAKFKLSAVNGNGIEKCIHDLGGPYRFEESKCSDYSLILPANFFFSNQLREDKIIIFCEMFVVGHCVNTLVQSNIEVADSKLIEDFYKLLDDEKFTDVTLVVDGQEFRAHKAILAARSDVFAAMFEHEFEERKSNCVDITDIQPQVLREMLHFIYTGKAPNINKMAKDLLVAADKYDLGKLSLMCEEELSVNLSVETAAETLIFADRHSAEQLKANTLAFINNHVIAVMRSPDWQKMMETHAYLMAEAFQVFAAQHCPKIERNTKET